MSNLQSLAEQKTNSYQKEIGSIKSVTYKLKEDYKQHEDMTQIEDEVAELQTVMENVHNKTRLLNLRLKDLKCKC